MKINARDFLREWLSNNLEAASPGSTLSKDASKLAKRCREDAAEQGINEHALTVAAYGNLVSFMEDEIFHSRLRNAS